MVHSLNYDATNIFYVIDVGFHLKLHNKKCMCYLHFTVDNLRVTVGRTEARMDR